MSEAIQHAKTLEDVVLDYLQNPDNGLPPGIFRQFYFGDPLEIPLSLLPCVTVEAVSTDIGVKYTGMDSIDTSIRISLIYNKRQDFGKNSNGVIGARELRQYAEGRSIANNQYAPISVMGILRRYFTLSEPANNYTVLDQLVNIKYNIVPRPHNSLTAEAWITVKFHQLVNVFNRQ